MVAGIRDEMKRIDPAHAADYDARAAAYVAKLEKLEKDGIDMLKDKKERKIVAFHDSLRYFGDTFGITIADFIQPEPGVDPSGSQMKKLIEQCKSSNIRIIAVEPQYPRNTSAATILKELRDAGVDAQFVEIDPLETADEAELTPDLYERKMRSNLENLAKALR
jgi:ABC-type Zn uptake system ZnuABC Zn-binding protein ZnuA